MLTTIILEKNYDYRRELQNIIQNRITINDTSDEYDMEISLSTDNILDVKNYIESHLEKSYLLFVDLDTVSQDIKIWKKIKDTVAFAEIVYLSDSDHMIQKIIDIHAEPLDIVKRDLNNDTVVQRIRENVDISFTRYKNNILTNWANFFSYEVSHGVLARIPFEQVYSVESILNNNKQVFLVCEKFTGSILGSLKHLEEQHQQKLFRCNRTTLVNIDNIILLDKKTKTLTLSNGNKHLISTRRVKKAMTILENISS
ncbi:LytTR family transcriptional regulator [Ligilactobacillus murinus]|uniref:LytTR family transcriptional regulator DNA-binding domain-containing protein n=1 Tax=Ligilactobacillus murinus TaxID=1622 RepID=UPI00107209CD|nr:LytTR family transcriptional regulator DNA-binding domain-containing protein [Ligilactobacillus murinus]MBF0759170.1 DNA-binding response regulator [Ligilactobacillus murinus]MBF0831399.1 DNA-binding response regulator [Ligilactobacillus murinus]TFU62738.1 LytTR family transcriptional regulator [Ligilactobacillus murinus]